MRLPLDNYLLLGVLGEGEGDDDDEYYYYPQDSRW